MEKQGTKALTNTKRVWNPPLVHHHLDATATTCIHLARRNKLVPAGFVNPTIASAKVEEELVAIPVPRHLMLPQILAPPVLRDAHHLVLAQMQRLPDTVPTGEELDRRHRRMVRLAQHGLAYPLEANPRERGDGRAADVVRPLAQEGGSADPVEDLTVRRARNVGNGGEEEDAGPEVGCACGGGGLEEEVVSVKDLDRDVGTDRVAHDEDAVERDTEARGETERALLGEAGG